MKTMELKNLWLWLWFGKMHWNERGAIWAKVSSHLPLILLIFCFGVYLNWIKGLIKSKRLNQMHLSLCQLSTHALLLLFTLLVTNEFHCYVLLLRCYWREFGCWFRDYGYLVKEIVEKIQVLPGSIQMITVWDVIYSPKNRDFKRTWFSLLTLPYNSWLHYSPTIFTFPTKLPTSKYFRFPLSKIPNPFLL